MLPISQSGEPGFQPDRKQPRPLNFQLTVKNEIIYCI
jgi:hypothetical protein